MFSALRQGTLSTIEKSIQVFLDSVENRAHREATILLVENDPGTVEQYKTLLISSGFVTDNIISASSGEDALHEMKYGSLYQAHLNVIVLDEHLDGDMRGTELAKKLKEEKLLQPYTKIVSISGYMKRSEARSRAPFLSSIIEKPIDNADFIATIESEALNSYYIKDSLDSATRSAQQELDRKEPLGENGINSFDDPIVQKQYEEICSLICSVKIKLPCDKGEDPEKKHQEAEYTKMALLSAVHDMFANAAVVGKDKQRASVAYLTLLHAFDCNPTIYRLERMLDLARKNDWKPSDVNVDGQKYSIEVVIYYLMKRLYDYNKMMGREVVKFQEIASRLRFLFFMKKTLFKEFVRMMKDPPFFLFKNFEDNTESLRSPCAELNKFLPNYISQNYWPLNERIR